MAGQEAGEIVVIEARTHQGGQGDPGGVQGLEPGVGVQFEPAFHQPAHEVGLVPTEALLHRLKAHHGVAVQPVDVRRRKRAIHRIHRRFEVPTHPEVQRPDLPQEGEQVQRQRDAQHRPRDQHETWGGTRTAGCLETDQEHHHEQTGHIVGKNPILGEVRPHHGAQGPRVENARPPDQADPEGRRGRPGQRPRDPEEQRRRPDHQTQETQDEQSAEVVEVPVVQVQDGNGRDQGCGQGQPDMFHTTPCSVLESTGTPTDRNEAGWPFMEYAACPSDRQSRATAANGDSG